MESIKKVWPYIKDGIILILIPVIVWVMNVNTNNAVIKVELDQLKEQVAASKTTSDQLVSLRLEFAGVKKDIEQALKKLDKLTGQ